MIKKGRIIAFFLIVFVLFGTIGTTVMNVAKGINLGLDLQGGFEVLYKVEPAKEGDVIDDKAMKSTVKALIERVDVLGVTEPNISIEGKDRIRVQLAGVTDQNKAREILSTEANLTFRDVNDKVLMNGADLSQGGAKVTYDEMNRPSVLIKIKEAKKFAEVTETVLNMAPNNLMVIWLDFEKGKDTYKAEAAKEEPKFISAASVNQVFNTKEATITGNFTVAEATQLADLLNAGSLPVKLTEMYSTSVGASFGEKALSETMFAGAIGIVFIFLFMIYFYRIPGIVATIMLIAYSYLTLLIFDWMNATLTLPGIAALILGVGIAVDANIITYERIKDELRLGRSTMAAFRAGNQRSLSTVLDANLTTLLAAGVMFFYGTSSVKGFATSLIVSVLVSFVTNLWGSRFVLSLLVNSKWLNNKPGYFGVKRSEILDLKTYKNQFPPTKFDKIDFVKVGSFFVKFSIVVTILGAIVLSVLGLNLGIDFTQGSRIEIKSEQKINVDEVKDFVEKQKITVEEVVPAGNEDMAIVRTKDVLGKDEISSFKTAVEKKYGHEPNVSTVSPTVGKELARNAFFALIIASIGIILYVTVRFEWTYAISAIVSLLHDAFLIVVFFSLLRLEVDITFIAAVLTIVGYSINDTIVTFDRIREHMKLSNKVKTKKDLEDIANDSIRQTLARSFNTVITVLFAVLALLVFGSDSIKNFSIALLVGLVAGTYSSIFVATKLWIYLAARQLNSKKKVDNDDIDNSEPQV